jgi:SAM-dependent methyltransferase
MSTRSVTGRVSGTEGYSENADTLAGLYESLTFAQVHRDVMHLIPTAPVQALDIGAGTGRDAAALAEMGHRVVAMEPTAALRAHGERLHPPPRIEWVDDALPELGRLRARPDRFGLIMATAVWMHLDAGQREQAMANVAPLLAPGGLFIMSLRHGPVPPGRRMFDVQAAETIALAEASGLSMAHHSERGDMFDRADVRWTLLAFRRER